MAAALLQTGQHCRGWWKLPNASPVPHSPNIEAVHSKSCLRRVRSIVKDSSHPSHRLSALLPSGRRYRVRVQGSLYRVQGPGPAGSGTCWSGTLLLPCGCHPAELCTPPSTHTPPPVTVLPPSTLAWTATHPPSATEQSHWAVIFNTVLSQL